LLQRRILGAGHAGRRNRHACRSAGRHAPILFAGRAMIGLLQRVTAAEVRVDDEVVGKIGRGLVVLIGVEREDSPAQAERLLERLLTYRVFPDSAERMNCSLQDVGGELLLVSQFTLAADTSKGTRAGFSTAAAPDKARELFDDLVRKAQQRHPRVQTGKFGADMQLTLTNDGPVTFWLQVRNSP
jgi:D-aminoacyl-tRNA deacylase